MKRYKALVTFRGKDCGYHRENTFFDMPDDWAGHPHAECVGVVAGDGSLMAEAPRPKPKAKPKSSSATAKKEATDE